MNPEDLHARIRAALGPRYLVLIAERLHVAHWNVETWAGGHILIPERHVVVIERFLAVQAETDYLVTRWIEALNQRAAEAELDRANIPASLAKWPEIGAACVNCAHDQSTPFAGDDRP